MRACKQYAESISLLIDGLLDEPERRALEKHLAVCPACAKRRDAFSAFRDMMPGMAETPPETLGPAILQTLSSQRSRRANPVWRGWVPMGAAAAVLALVLLLRGFPFGPFETQEFSPLMVQSELYGLLDEGQGETGMWGSDVHIKSAAELENEDVSAPMPACEPLPTSAPAMDAKEPACTAVVTLYAEQVPEQLAGYPRTDRGAYTEIVLPREEFDTLWPDLRAAGGRLSDNGSGDIRITENAGAASSSAPTDAQFNDELGRNALPERTWAKIVIYFEP